MPHSRHRTQNDGARHESTDDAAAVPIATGEAIEAAPSAEERQTAWDELLPTERNTLRFYLNEIGKTPLLTGEEEVSLARRIQAGDTAARDAMIKANLRLVVRIARDYENFGLPLLDLISEGNIGLMKAVERFDPDKGGKLSTYAAWWIRQALKRALASHGKTIRLPMHLVDRIGAMRKVIHKLHDELHRDPTDDEIALVMEIPVRKVVHMKTVATRAASLDAPVGEEGDATFGDFIGDDSQADPFETLRGKNAADEVRGIVDRLDPREADIIKLRFGLGGESALTLEEVGERYKLTRERIRQVEHLAIMKLRRLMADRERQRSADDLKDEAVAEARRREINEYLRRKKQESDERTERLRHAVRFTPTPFPEKETQAVAAEERPRHKPREAPATRPVRRNGGTRSGLPTP